MRMSWLLVRYAAIGSAIRVVSLVLIILAAIGSGAVREASLPVAASNGEVAADPAPFTYSPLSLILELIVAPFIESMVIAIGCLFLRSLRCPPWLIGVVFAVIGFGIHSNAMSRISGLLVFGACAWLFSLRTPAFEGDPPLARRTRGFVENYLAIVALHFGFNVANVTLTVGLSALATLED
jgi:hypothetical protein